MGSYALRAVALLLWASHASASPESDAVLANFGPLEWIAGTDHGELNNGSAWLPSFEGELATEVDLSEPHAATGDLLGNVYVADKNAHAIRVIGRDGRIRTVAGTNTGGYDGDGPATARQLNGPQNVYPMPDGSYYILDTGNQRIRHVDAAGQMTTVIHETAGLSRGLWVKRDGSLIYYCTNTALKRWTPALGDHPGTVMANGFSELGNLDVAANGEVYLTDRGATATDPTFSQVFRIVPQATPATFTPQRVAGTGGTTDSGPGANGSLALNTGLYGVRGIAFHPAGGYFLATHRGGDVWYVDTAGVIQMVVRGDNGNTHTNTPMPLPVTTNSISEVRAISVAPNGDLLMATNDNGFIRRARYTGPLPAVPGIRVAPPRASGGPAELTWTQTAGSWFRLESSSDPAAEIWQLRQIGRGTGYPQQWTDPSGTSTQPRQFYRLRGFRAWPN